MERIWRGSAEQFRARFNFVLSSGHRQLLDRAEGLGEPLIAVLDEYPFGRYLRALDIDEARIVRVGEER